MKLGKSFIIIGIFFVILGLLFTFGPRIPFLGKLPGDFIIRKENFTFYFPLVSSIVISIILTIVINLILRLFHK